MNSATEDTKQQGPGKGSAGRVNSGGEVYDTQVTSTHASTKTSLTDSTGPSQVDPESSKTSFNSIRDGGDKHEHLRYSKIHSKALSYDSIIMLTYT